MQKQVDLDGKHFFAPEYTQLKFNSNEVDWKELPQGTTHVIEVTGSNAPYTVRACNGTAKVNPRGWCYVETSKGFKTLKGSKDLVDVNGRVTQKLVIHFNPNMLQSRAIHRSFLEAQKIIKDEGQKALKAQKAKEKGFKIQVSQKIKPKLGGNIPELVAVLVVACILGVAASMLHTYIS